MGAVLGNDANEALRVVSNDFNGPLVIWEGRNEKENGSCFHWLHIGTTTRVQSFLPGYTKVNSGASGYRGIGFSILEGCIEVHGI